MCKYIKWFGLALLLFCVMRQPQEVSAYPKQPANESVMLNNSDGDLDISGYCVFDIEYYSGSGDLRIQRIMLAPYVPTATSEKTVYYINSDVKNSTGVYVTYKTQNNRCVAWEKSWSTTTQSSGWYVYGKGNVSSLDYMYYFQNGTITNVQYGENAIVYVNNVDITAPTPTPTPSPTPTPTSSPTPTPIPVANVEMSETGITKLFDGAMRIFNIPMKIGGIEFTWWQIFVYLILAFLVIDLIFSPSDK